MLSLSNGDVFGFGSLISLILVASLLVVYSLLTSGFKLRIPSIDIEACIEDMSFRFPGLLGMAIAAQILILGPPTSDITTVLMSGSFKAASWFFVIKTVRAYSCYKTSLANRNRQTKHLGPWRRLSEHLLSLPPGIPSHKLPNFRLFRTSWCRHSHFFKSRS